MNINDKIFIVALLLIFLFAQAIYQARKFKRNKPISHFWHSVYYGAYSGIIIIAYIIAGITKAVWAIPIIALSLRLAAFDIILNIARGKRLLYNGRGTTDSDQDKIENNLSEFWVAVLKVLYLFIFGITIFIAK